MQLYIHIPFCIKKCRYCAFNSIHADKHLIDLYIDALCREIEVTSRIIEDYFINKDISTIYFGGGTPTILNLNQIETIINEIRNRFHFAACKEITVEANPGTIDLKYLQGMRALGFNRISIGVQSFDDELLKILGRIHDSKVAFEAVQMAKSIFENVSLDLMYGLPTQTLSILHKSVEMATSFNVNHISIYGLEIEEGTEFGKLFEAGNLNLPSNDEVGDMYDYIVKELPSRGFKRYEISNFAKTGFESRHNLGYWSDKNYFGFGAGAHSYIKEEIFIKRIIDEFGFNDETDIENVKGLRWSNISNVNDYIKGFNSTELKVNHIGNFRQLEEVVTMERAIEEYCFLGLRKSEGINIDEFNKKFGIEIYKIFGETINKLRANRLIEEFSGYLRLTDKGMQFGNQVFAEFLLPTAIN